MTFSKIGRMLTALVASAALGLGMTACGGGTIGYMWVLGTFYNQISGFLIDDFTGNLTAIAHSPFPSGGTNPVSIVVKPGGRYVYVINSGSGATGTPGTASFNSPGAAIAEFSVGTGGILTFEQTFFSQGVNPVWATFDSTGNFLYVLDKYSPDYGTVINGSTSTNGSITAFAVDGSTGRLTLVTNNAVLTAGKAQTYFDVGSSPTMTTVGSGGCLFTLSANSIYPYIVNSSSGQLTVATTGATVISAPTGGLTPTFSSINTGIGSSASAFTFLTDSANNFIYTLQAGSSSCSLTQVAGSQMTNVQGTNNPVYSITSNSGKFLYVLNYNFAGTTTTANSSISAFTINSLGQLATLADTTNNPYAVGSGPTCAVQDPTHQYLYTSNHFDNTVTGKLIDQNRGFLSNLTRGTVFPSTQTPTCMAISGNL